MGYEVDYDRRRRKKNAKREKIIFRIEMLALVGLSGISYFIFLKPAISNWLGRTALVIDAKNIEPVKKLTIQTVPPQASSPVAVPAPVTNSSSYYKCINNGKTIYSGQRCDAGASSIPFGVSVVPAFAKTVPALVQDSQPRSMTLNLGRNGGYFMAGTVGGVAASFQVDTGASVVAISQAVAVRAGISSCERMEVINTANGSVNVCVATVAYITFGIFRMNNVLVHVQPNMAQDVLLGMPVLRLLKIHQQNGVMTISD